MTLLDWRRRVAALYAAVRADAGADPEGALARFRAGRDRLFAEHPDSPLPADKRPTFPGIPYWPYDPELRFEVEVEPAPAERLTAHSNSGDPYPLDRIGRVTLPVATLDVYWVAVYGGGVFLPFRDDTSGGESYGGGRYLLDTVKGADLGGSGGRLVRRLQLRVQPIVRIRPAMELPLAPPAKSAHGSHSDRRALPGRQRLKRHAGGTASHGRAVRLRDHRRRCGREAATYMARARGASVAIVDRALFGGHARFGPAYRRRRCSMPPRSTRAGATTTGSGRLHDATT